MTLEELSAVLESRKGDDPADSYVASLYAGGVAKIAQKLGEEAVETVIAAQGSSRDAVIAETVDLWFHSLVLLAHLDLGPQDVLAELERRSGTSGHVEKSSRNPGN